MTTEGVGGRERTKDQVHKEKWRTKRKGRHSIKESKERVNGFNNEKGETGK